MRKAAVLAVVWIAVVVVIFVINSVIYEDDAPSRPSDGWCDLLPSACRMPMIPIARVGTGEARHRTVGR